MTTKEKCISVLYNIFIHLFNLSYRLYALFNSKAAKRIKGLDHQTIIQNFNQIQSKDKLHIWFHCASLGEFEQGRTVIEKLKEKSDCYISLSFFSPSGYEIRKNYPLADQVFYLPTDTPANAKKFIQQLQPDIAVFVKYDFWFNFFKTLHQNKIPLIMIACKFRPGQIFFRSYGFIHRQMLKYVKTFHVQDKNSKNLLLKIGIEKVKVTPDTRIDRVLSIKNKNVSLPEIEEFLGEKTEKAFIGGSIYLKEAEMISRAMEEGFINGKVILAPHIIKSSYVAKIAAFFNDKALLFSRFKKNPYSANSKSVLIIDEIGILSSLYKYGNIAFIGGGFGKSIHNTLEPAAFGIPVILGPNYHKFKEAEDLIVMGGAFTVINYEVFIQVLQDLDRYGYEKAGKICSEYIQVNSGGSDVIVEEVVRSDWSE